MKEDGHIIIMKKLDELYLQDDRELCVTEEILEDRKKTWGAYERLFSKIWKVWFKT